MRSIRYHIIKQKAVIAFMFLALATAYSFKVTIDQGHQATEQLNAQREARANDIVASLAEGATSGCISANEVTLGMHKVVVGSYEAGVKSVDQFVVEGTLSPIQSKRVLRDSFRTTTQYLRDLPYRDCEAAPDRYLKRVSDKARLKQVADLVHEQAALAEVVRTHDEPKLTPPPSKD